MGSITSVTDYGEHTRLSDAELIAKVKDGNYYTQACKVVDKDNRFCDYLMIATNNSGYTVKAIWEGK
tara:strand:+ start:1105 stop:1305 length:201 start_codon:yes stop_codon:yes gene_type:complete